MYKLDSTRSWKFRNLVSALVMKLQEGSSELVESFKQEEELKHGGNQANDNSQIHAIKGKMIKDDDQCGADS